MKLKKKSIDIKNIKDILLRKFRNNSERLTLVIVEIMKSQINPVIYQNMKSKL